MEESGPLSAEQLVVLDRIRRRAVGRVSQRAHMVQLRARGYSVAQIAEIFDVDPKTVRDWLRRYQREGPVGLDDRPRPGRPLRDRLARHIIDTQASSSPRCSGLVQSYWTAGLLAAFVHARFRLLLSAATVRRHLHAADWRWARPRLAPATHAPAGQRKHDPEKSAKLARLADALTLTPADGARVVVFLDECDVQLLPVIRSCWMKGARWRIPTPGQNVKRVLFGALDARTGQLQYLVQRRKRACDFIAFLEHLALVYPVGTVILVMDNVVTHNALVVRQWLAQPAHQRFTVLWLPKYSAHEHNPIERVWGLMKTAVAANRLHGSIEALEAAATRFLTETRFNAPYPDKTPISALPRAA